MSFAQDDASGNTCWVYLFYSKYTIASVHKDQCRVWMVSAFFFFFSTYWFHCGNCPSCLSHLHFSLHLFLSLVKSLLQRCYYIVFLISFGAENAWFHFSAAAAAPAACRDAHAALRCSLAVALRGLQPLAVWLALCALRSVVDAASWGAGSWLGGDGAQQVVPLPQEVAVCAQAKAALTQNHAGAAGLGWPRTVVVLQLWQMSCISLCDELLRGDFFIIKAVNWCVLN